MGLGLPVVIGHITSWTFSDILDRTNLAPLHTATSSDNLAVVSALVAAGANPNLHGIGGATPLHIGVRFVTSLQQITYAQLLLVFLLLSIE